MSSSVVEEYRDEKLKPFFGLLEESTGLSEDKLVLALLASVSLLIMLTVFFVFRLFKKKKVAQPATTSAVVPSEKSNGVSNSKAAKVTKESASPTSPTLPTEVSPAAIVIPSTPPATPSPSSPESPQVLLHSGVLKKRQLFNNRVSNSFELLQEDDSNIAIHYSAGDASPRSVKNKKSLYLGSESAVEIPSNSKTKFTIFQLKNGGKKLNLEAKTQQERDDWVTKVQNAIQQLKRSKA